MEATEAVAADLTWSFVNADERHGDGFGSDDFPVHQPFLRPLEKLYGPVLATHVRAVPDI